MDWLEPPVVVNRAAEIYSQMPSPPPVFMPSSAREGTDQIHAYISQQTEAARRANSFEHTDFLQTITYDEDFRNAERTAKEWKYEWRREAQQILPFLYLGPASAARDTSFLQREAITAVMACRDLSSARANLLVPKAAAELGLECLSIDVAGNQGLIAALPRAIDAINVHLTRMDHALDASTQGHAPRPSVPGKVLVFCETGNERSTAVVTAYIMAMYSVNFVQAFQLIQSHRFCVSFDDAARQLLKTFDSILQARRDVARGHLQSVGQADTALQGSNFVEGGATIALPEPHGLKRSHGETMVETEGGSQEVRESHELMDFDRFVGRPGPAPFYDSP